MAKPILIANWKNHPNSLKEAQTLLKDLSKKRLLYKKVALFIAPPEPFLSIVAEKSTSFSQLASQDIPALSKGSHTGEITPEILKNFGVRLSIIGHSERRALGETPAQIREKVRVALRSGVTPLICLGEKEKDVEGEHFELLRQEIRSLIGDLSKSEIKKVALAYEPVWAIGKSADEAIEPNDLTQTVLFIKKALADLFGRAVADEIPVIYGGSVEPINAVELMKTGIRGFLVGHASLKGKSFEAIAQAVLSK